MKTNEERRTELNEAGRSLELCGLEVWKCEQALKAAKESQDKAQRMYNKLLGIKN